MALGSLGASSFATSLLTLIVIVAAAVFVSSATSLGLRGSSFFVLVGGMGTFLPFDLSALGGRMLLMVLGAAAGWMVAMPPWLIRPAIPQERAVVAAQRRLAAMRDASASDDHESARLKMIEALHRSNRSLAEAGPRAPAAGRLRRLHADLRRLFRIGTGGGVVDAEEWARVCELSEQITRSPARIWSPRSTDDSELLIAPPPSVWSSAALFVMLRSVVVVTASMSIAALIGLSRPYWAAIAGVAVIQGSSTQLTLRRGDQRSVETVVGVGTAALLILVHPGPGAIVAAVVVLQLLVELFVVDHYAASVAFITPLALLLAQIGQPTAGPWTLTGDRLAETLIGCAVAALAGIAVLPHAATSRLPAAIERTRQAEAALSAVLDAPAIDRIALLAARQRLSAAISALAQVEASASGELAVPWDAATSPDRSSLLVEATTVSADA